MVSKRYVACLKKMLRPDFFAESKQRGLVAGVDEAGCGAWAGPVVAAAVIFIEQHMDFLKEINDSKKLNKAKREDLYYKLRQSPHTLIGVGQCSSEEVDILNIRQATKQAMRLAVENLPQRPDFLLIDGTFALTEFMPSEALIKGDQKSLSVAAASIVAKVTRDKIMLDLSKEYPDFGFHKNVGYGTKGHVSILVEKGITPIHRKSYKPIQALLLSQAL